MNEEINVENTTEQTPVQQINQMKEEPAKCGNYHNCRCGMIFNIILLLGLVALYVLFFMNKSKPKDTINHVPVSIKSNISIAYINTDSIMENYEFAKDMKKEIEDYQVKLEGEYKAKIAAFKNEYDTYLKTGASLKLSEQKKKEEELTIKQNSMLGLKEEMGNQIMKRQQAISTRLLDTIFAYINRFNEKPKYTYILKKSSDHGILFANDSLEITKDILKGLNQEYKKFK
jgi:outer membrane protein